MSQAIIVGLGIVCGIGIGKKEIMENILRNQADLREISKFSVDGSDMRYVSEVVDKKIPYLSEKKERLLDRTSAYLLTALDEAIEEAGLDVSRFDAERIGILLGTSLAGSERAEKFYKQYRHGETRKDIKNLLQYPLYTCADIISQRYGIRGPKLVISTACSSSATAVGYAADWIHLGFADVVITGGGDPLDELSYAGFYSLGNMSKEKCSPFSKKSVGLSLGEGAAVFILLSDRVALDWKDNNYGVVKGFGIGADGYHPTAPDPQGKAACFAMEKAINYGKLNGELSRIEYINAHGTGTIHNDRFETFMIKKTFGEDLATQIKVSSTKSMTGHTLGAAGAVEIALSCVGMRNNFLPPTINFSENREGCDLNYIPNHALTDHPIHHFLSNSFGFGGNNASVLVGKYNGYGDHDQQNIQSSGVVVTGIGCISALGNSLDEIVKKIYLGISGIHKEENEIIGFCRRKCTRSSRIKNFNLNAIRRFSNERRMDRISRLAVGASYLALKDAQMVVTPQNDRDIGLVYSTGTGPMETLTGFYDTLIEKGLLAGKSALFANTVANAAAGYVGIENHIKGYTTTITNGYVSGLLALVVGAHFIQRQYCRQTLIGCADEYSLPLHQGLLGLGLICPNGKEYPEEMLPMGKDRNGAILGEGSIFMLLERKDTAQVHKRRIYGEIAGFSVASDICGIGKNDPNGEGMKLAIQSALNQSGLRPEQIDAIFSSASGYKLKDASEGVAIRKLFASVPVVALSPFFGDVNGSTGLFSLAVVFAAMEINQLPGIPHHYEIDPVIGVNLIQGTPIPQKLEHVLIIVNAFGGLNVALVARRTIRS